MRLSEIAKGMEISLTRQLFNKAKKFNDVIDLTLGDPDLTPSEKIREAAAKAISAGKTHYSVNAGLIQAREAIADCFKAEYGIDVDPAAEVMLTIGGMGALYLSLAAIVNPGDEVLIIGPYYVNYVQMVRMCGGIPVIHYTDPKNDFRIDVQALEEKVTDKTIALIINSPSNPSSVVIDSKTLDQLADLAKKRGLIVISDEVYRTLLYDNVEYDSIIKREGMKERTVLIDSMSKRFSMTGYRCGYAIGPAEVIGAMTKMQENTASCTPLPSQYAAIEGYTNCRDEHWIRDEFEKRRDFIWKAINDIPGFSCTKPAATFYLFVNIEAFGLDSVSFAYKLLEDQHIAVVPGITYGEPYDGYIRIAFTKKIGVLEEATDRLRKFAVNMGAEKK